jgi:hypothetical protein
MSSGALVVLLALWPGALTLAQSPPPGVECADWRTCRDATEAALAADEAERAHDLAWRAVQRGPRDDAALMFLLARAQARSGRVDDALVMIRRLAQRPVPTEAATHPDLERVRALPAWADVAALVASAGSGPPPPTPKGTAKPAARTGRRGPDGASPATPTFASAAAPAPAEGAPAAAVATAVRASDARAEDALRFSAEPFRAGGLAYDAVSHRFLLGDRDGRKLRVAAEGLSAAVDLVREQSAGFHDVQAVDIDARRGDLWVASAEPGGAATLHKLQLISGRPLRAYPLAGTGEARPVDLAVADDGTVVTVDEAGRVYRLAPDAASVEPVATVEGGRATSLAVMPRGAAYVAHAGGVTRIDLGTGRTAAVTAGGDVTLTGIERLRAHRAGLAAIQAQPDGSRRVLRLELAPSGRTVRGVTTFEVRVAAEAGPVFAAVIGDDLAFVTTGEAAAPTGPPREFVVRRVRLR